MHVRRHGFEDLGLPLGSIHPVVGDTTSRQAVHPADQPDYDAECPDAERAALYDGAHQACDRDHHKCGAERRGDDNTVTVCLGVEFHEGTVKKQGVTQREKDKTDDNKPQACEPAGDRSEFHGSPKISHDRRGNRSGRAQRRQAQGRISIQAEQKKGM